MTEIFESFIESYIQNKVGISESFLSPGISDGLKNNLINLFDKKLLKDARIGNNDITVENHEIRKDKIFWLDRKYNNDSEIAFFDLMDAFVLYLNESCFTGITSYEFHYALYEKGSFYKKHFDQFKSNSSRQYTMIFYLNENWTQGDGGELCIYKNSIGENINPTFGKSIFFKSSELEHEVLECHKKRLSVTGWLKID